MADDKTAPSNELGLLAGRWSPLGEFPWSPDFVMQAIEILPVCLRAGAIFALKPAHADSLVVGWPAGEKPEGIAAQTCERVGFRPTLLHSTSWRTSGREVVLTYLAVVRTGEEMPEFWEELPVERTELARGDATAPPPVIGVSQVLEHALRHLAWLSRDDEVVKREVAAWADALERYVPEPFRAFGTP